jgi:ADP-ribose pyrophosphatase YjhB (NUDIX family)
MEVKDAFKFCPRCGSKLEPKDNFLKCGECDLNFYINPKPVTSVILQDKDGRYLFVKRSVEPRKGYWDFPGGFAEENEDFEQSARRETKEELGVDVGKLEYLSTHIDSYLYQEINYRVIGVTFTGRVPDNAVFMPDDDVESYQFFDRDKFPIDKLAWPSMHEMIQKLPKI